MTKYTKAMSQEELISRLKSLHIELRYMVDTVEAIKKNIEYKYYIEYNNGIKTLEEDNDWIPCSERLPEEGEKVLASTTNTVFTQVFKGTHGTFDSWWWNNNTIKTIYAWMPLPTPYKGGDDE